MRGAVPSSFETAPSGPLSSRPLPLRSLCEPLRSQWNLGLPFAQDEGTIHPIALRGRCTTDHLEDKAPWRRSGPIDANQCMDQFAVSSRVGLADMTSRNGRDLGQLSHASARTAAAVRRAIQHGHESQKTLSRRHRIKEKTVLNRPWAQGEADRINRTINAATAKRHCRQSHTPVKQHPRATAANLSNCLTA